MAMDKQELMELLKRYNLDHGEAEVWVEHQDGTVTVIIDGLHHTHEFIEGVPLDSKPEAMRHIARILRKRKGNWQVYFNDLIDDPVISKALADGETSVDDLYQQFQEDYKSFVRIAGRLVHDAGEIVSGDGSLR